MWTRFAKGLLLGLALYAGTGLGGIAMATEPTFAEPEWQSFRRGYVQRRDELQTRQQAAQQAWVKARHEEMEEAVRQATLARNARAIMVAREGRTLFETFGEQLAAGEPLVWPEQVRPELRENLARWKAQWQELETGQVEEMDAFNQQVQERFANHWARVVGTPLPSAEQDAQFTRFQAYDPTPVADLPEVAMPETKEDEPAEPQDEWAPAVRMDTEPDSPYFAVSRVAPENAIWAAVFEWTGEMHGVDVIRLDVFEQTDRRNWQQLNNTSGREAELTLRPHANLPQRNDYYWRLKTIDGRDPVSVLEWPSRRNDWQLVIRTPLSSRSPHPTGFQLEAALDGFDLATGLERAGRLIEADTATATDTGTIAVTIESVPSFAMIYVNGQSYRGPRGPVTTPYTLQLPPRPHHIRLTQRFFEDWVRESFVPQADATVVAQFEPRHDMPWQTIRYQPGPGWDRSRIALQPGDTLFIQVEGMWQIGSMRERIGPDGYSPDRFPHYYPADEDLRLTPDAPYGAFLFRLGYYGTTNTVHDAPLFPAPTHAGVQVWFNVNEREDRVLRQDNRGQIDVRYAIVNRGTFE